MRLVKGFYLGSFVRHNTVLAALFVGLTLGFAPLQEAEARLIDFEEILAAPDDIKLNLEYARQQVSTGRLEQAASALERILLLKPNWDAVRLFYGIVLFRLGDLESTKRELALLEGRGLSNSQESDRLKYLARASKDTQSVRLKGRYSIGVRHDSNANRASSIAAQLDGVGVFEDEAAVASLQLRAEVDLNNGQGDYLFVQGDALATEYFDLNRADLLSGQLKVGAALHLKDFLFTPYGTYDATVLRDEKFRERLGGGLDSQWSVTAQSTLFLDGSVFYEDYSTTSFSTVGSLRDGWLYGLRGGYKVRPTDWQHLTFESQFAVKDAKNSGYDYDELQFRIRSLTLLGEGRYLSLSGGYTRTEYDQADGVTSTNFAREDDRYDAKMLLGLPMEYILGGIGLTTPKPLEGYVAQGGASWISQHSSIDRLDFENWSGELMFTKRFAF